MRDMIVKWEEIEEKSKEIAREFMSNEKISETLKSEILKYNANKINKYILIGSVLKHLSTDQLKRSFAKKIINEKIADNKEIIAAYTLVLTSNKKEIEKLIRLDNFAQGLWIIYDYLRMNKQISKKINVTTIKPEIAMQAISLLTGIIDDYYNSDKKTTNFAFWVRKILLGKDKDRNKKEKLLDLDIVIDLDNNLVSISDSTGNSVSGNLNNMKEMLVNIFGKNITIISFKNIAVYQEERGLSGKTNQIQFLEE